MKLRPFFFLFAILPGVWLAELACGEDLPPTPESQDATTDGVSAENEASAEAGDAAAPRCSLDKPFGQIKTIPFLERPEILQDGGAVDRQPRLSADELVIVFTSQRQSSNGAWSIYLAERATTKDQFGKPRKQTAISGGPTALDIDPMLSANGTTLYFSSIRGGTIGADLYLARRTGFGADFEAPVEKLVTTSSSWNDFHPYKTTGGLWFGSDRPDGGPKDIWFAPQLENGFGDPVPVGGLTTAQNESHPTPTDDGLAIYFTRTGGGGGHIHLARRNAPTGDFDNGTLVAELSDGGGDSELAGWLSADRCRLYYVHAASGLGELVYVEREP